MDDPRVLVLVIGATNDRPVPRFVAGVVVGALICGAGLLILRLAILMMPCAH
jgi:hypothetical protein